MKIIHFLLIATASVLLPSCATKLSKKQQAAITSLRIPPAVTAGAVYTKPRAMDTTAVMAGAGAAGGAIGGLIVGIAGEIVQANYNHKHKASLNTVQAGLPPDLSTQIASEVSQQLQSSSFFGSRFQAPDSGHKLVITLVSYGLGSYSGGVRALVTLKVHITDTAGRVIWKSGTLSQGVCGNTTMVDQYASRPGLASEHFRIAARAASKSVVKQLLKATS